MDFIKRRKDINLSKEVQILVNELIRRESAMPDVSQLQKKIKALQDYAFELQESLDRAVEFISLKGLGEEWKSYHP